MQSGKFAVRLIAFVLVLALSASGCAKLTLAWADLEARGEPARPAVLGVSANPGPVDSVEKWEKERAPELRAGLQREVYGSMPDAAASRVIEHRVLNEAAFGGKGRLEEYHIAAEATFGGVSVAVRNTRTGAEGFIMDVVSPAGAAGPVPVILMQTFCPRWDTLPDPALSPPAESGSCNNGGVTSSLANYVFGRYIATPPVEEILDRGYAIAAIYPSEAVPDNSGRGLAELRRLSAGHSDDETRWGAIAAWGWLYSRMVDVLEADPRFDNEAMIVWGHSRYAKATLVAAAFDERIDGVIAHQSGTGGASLSRRKKGESVAAITGQYPHWFSTSYARFAGREDEMSVDQHFLLALIAPRPMLLGNARRDVWSDPNGALRAAIGAEPAYRLYGARGLAHERMIPYRPDADIAFWIRPGTHGVVKEDWPAFLDFLDAHFKAAPAATH